MFENDAIGWHGSYSLAGRASAEKYPMIIYKDSLIKNKNKNHKKEGFAFKSIFTPDQANKNEYTENNVNAFKVYTKKSNYEKLLQELEDEKENKIKRKKTFDNERYKYHNKHIKEGRKKKEVINPSCTKYRPNHNFIWSRTITGPKWKSIQGRNTKKPIVDNKDFFMKDISMDTRNKCFVNMDRQTQRGDSLHGRDVRIRTDITFHKRDIDNLTTMQTLSQTSTPENTDKTTINIDKSIISDNNNSIQKQQYIKGPNFSKTISREQVDKVKNPKNTTPYFKDPKYSLTHERILTISSFSHPKTIPRSVKTMDGIAPGFMYDPDKVITNINNHKKPAGLKFDSISIRPDNEKLPTFMVNMFNRHGVNFITNQTLKMNNYQNSSFQKTMNSGFFPKRSFNRFVNMKLLEGERYKNMKDNDEEVKNEKMSLTERSKIKNCGAHIEFANSEYEHRFDNVTFKTLKKKIFAEDNDLDKFNLDYY